MEVKLMSTYPGFGDTTTGTIMKVKEALLTTIGKTPTETTEKKILEMTDDEIFKWMVGLLLAEHSLSKCIDIRITDTMQKDVRNQIFRHTKSSPHFYAQSSRPDWNEGKPRDPNEKTKNVMDFNAEGFLAMTRQRLCLRTETNTRKWMNDVIKTMLESDNPILRALAAVSVPNCVYRAGCPEKSLGHCDCKYFDNIGKALCFYDLELLPLEDRCMRYHKLK